MQDYQCVEETSMVRLRYDDLARKALDVWDMTSLTRDEFQTLGAPFEAAFYLFDPSVIQESPFHPCEGLQCSCRFVRESPGRFERGK